MFNAYAEPEEVDNARGSFQGVKKDDPRRADMARVRGDVKQSIKHVKATKPQVAKEMENFLLRRNELDDLVEGKNDNDFGDVEKLVKFYPGSSKGPDPAHDPEHYSEWFMRNQPTEYLYQGEDKKNFHDIGVRYKWIWAKQKLDEGALPVEDKDYAEAHVELPELYQMQSYPAD